MIGRNDAQSASPSGKHLFVEPGDTRSGLAVAAVHGGLQQATSLAVADASVRSRPCAVKGCGRPRHDPIHEPEE